MKYDLNFGKFGIAQSEYQPVVDKIHSMMEIHSDCKIILCLLTGSRSYGTNTPKSDVDVRFIYVQDLDSILSNTYKEQVSGGLELDNTGKEKQDIVGYEIQRFLELATTNNPNILETLMIDETIVYQDPIWNMIKEQRNKFVSKLCYGSFYNYALSQISKAKGLNKAINNPIPVERQTPIDFCHIIKDNGSIKLPNFLEDNNFEQKFCGLVNIPNCHGIYGLYYDKVQELCFSEDITEDIRNENKKFRKDRNLKVGFGFKGIEKESVDSNQLRLSSIPKKKEIEVIGVSNNEFVDERYFDGFVNIKLANAIEFLGNVSFNQSGYEKYCLDYNRYHAWLKDRNEERYNDNLKGHQGFDHKNMMHCIRLLDCAYEIATTGTFSVKRSNIEYLLKIRMGEMSYEDVLSVANEKSDKIKFAFENSTLPQKVDIDFVRNLLLTFRKKYYSMN